MRLRSYVRLLLMLVFAIGLFLPPSAVLPTNAQQSTRSDGLDTPLGFITKCGSGDPQDVHFTIAATGDTLLHRNIQAVGEAQGYDYLFDHIRPFVQAADLAYTNIEGSMVQSSPLSGYPTFNYNPTLAQALKNLGIDVVSSANNHIMDRGPSGVDETLSSLQAAGIAHHGAIPSGDVEQPRPPYVPITLTRNGTSITVGFLSFTWGTNGIPDPHNQVNLIWTTNDYGQQGAVSHHMLDAIAQAKRETDLVVVATHWGTEYVFYPSAQQVMTAQQMAQAGADVILGGHPHTLQPVDIIATNGRKTLVIYSLGNFIAAQGIYNATSFTSTSVIFYVGVVKQADGQVRVTGFRYLPTTVIDYDTRPAPIPDPPQGQAYMIDHIHLMMRDFQGALQVSPDPALLGERVEICPSYTFPEAPGATLRGDFAQYITTLGSGTTPRATHEWLSVFGYPMGGVGYEQSADCRWTVPVLYTQRQRLEYYPSDNWGSRIVGTQLGTAVYKQRYGMENLRRYRHLDGSPIILDDDFRAFFEQYGGLAIFGYPISPIILEEDSQSGEKKTVQYFERARFERVVGAQHHPDLLQRVHLGLLSEEYDGYKDSETRCQVGTHGGTDASGGAGSGTMASPQSLPNLPPPSSPMVHSIPNGRTLRAIPQQRTIPAWWGWMTIALGGVLLADSGHRLRQRG